MKKLILSALLTVSIFVSAFATDENKVNYRVREHFKFNFKDAADVEWTLKPGFAKATFTEKGEKVEAFYELDGDIIGVSRNIKVDDLPVNAKRTFAKKYDGYNVKEAIRFDGTTEVNYYISADNGGHSVILKVSEGGLCSIFKQSKKG